MGDGRIPWELPLRNVEQRSKELRQALKRLPEEKARPMAALLDAYLSLEEQFSGLHGGLGIQHRGLAVIGWVGSLYGAQPVEERHRPLQETIRERNIPRAWLLDFVDALNMRLMKPALRDMAEFRMFARRFAGAPLRSFARVLGAEVEGREDELDALAAAWLVRRIMGGLRKDMALGRMYVPMAVLSQAGATPQEMTAESLSAAARDALKEFAEAGLEELRRGERVLELLPADGSREWAAREVVRVRGDLEQWKARPEAAGAATRGGWKSVLGIFKGKES